MSSGITLIALVVTIIILLILAGISIQMLTGDNGILTRAGEAKESTEKSQILEEVRLDIAGAQIQKNGKSLDKSELKEILKKYFKDVDQIDIPNEITSSTNTELITLNEKYTVKLSEIYSGKLATLPAGLYKSGTNEQISSWTDIVGNGKCVTISNSGVLERNAFEVGDIKVKLVIDSSVKTIGNMSGISQLEEVEIPEGVTSIESYGFSGCSNLKRIEIPSSVTSISSAFSGCSKLEKLEIPDAVTSISGGTLAGCVKLESIYIPNGIKSFVGGLFYNCSSLTDVYYDGGKDEWVGISIEDGNDILSASTTTIHYLRQKFDEDYWDKIYIGATIVGYDPSIASDGSKINTSYTSLGSNNSNATGTYGDGTTGNGEANTIFAVSSIKKWQILGLDETNKQILITSAGTPTPVQEGTSSVKLMPFRGRSGYVSYIDELNKICAIYGQGKYADTTKYNVQLNSSTISTGGRSISIDDFESLGYKKGTTSNLTFTKNSSDGYIYCGSTKTNSTEFNYWGEDVVPIEGTQWKSLEAGQSVTISVVGPYNNNASKKAEDVIYIRTAYDVNLGNWSYWIADRSTSWFSSYSGEVRFNVFSLSKGQETLSVSKWNYPSGNSCGVRPVIYLKPNLKLSYNPTTQAFAIESE